MRQYRSAKAESVSSCPTFHLAHLIRGLGGVLQGSGFLLIFSTSQLKRSFRTLSPPLLAFFSILLLRISGRFLFHRLYQRQSFAKVLGQR